MSAPAVVQRTVTAHDVVEKLRVRYPAPGWFADSELTLRGRRVDFAALAVWGSEHYRLVCAEVKVARADWLRELQQHEKARGWTEACDEFYIVAPKGIVQKDEVPREWGFLELCGERLFTRAYAPKREHRAEIPREVFARMVGRLVERVQRGEYAATRIAEQEIVKRERAHFDRECAELRARATEAERQYHGLLRALGVEPHEWNRESRALQIARAIAPAFTGHDDPHAAMRRRVAGLVEQHEAVVQQMRDVLTRLDAIDSPPPPHPREAADAQDDAAEGPCREARVPRDREEHRPQRRLRRDAEA
jgi:hypothetical protein